MKKLLESKLFTLIVALFMTVCALLGITATLPRPTKAATAETPAITADSIKDVSKYSKIDIGYRVDISAKLIYWTDLNNNLDSLAGWALNFTDDIYYFYNGGTDGLMKGSTAVAIDNPSALVLKEQKAANGALMGLFIYCTGEVVTFNDGAYSFDPKNGLLPDGCSIYGEVRCSLSELVERTDTSEYIESDYTLGTAITGYVRFKAEAVAETGWIQFYDGNKEIFIQLNTNDESLCFWGTSIDVMETLDGAYVVNRGETFIDVYFENEITIASGLTEGYTVHTLTAPAEENPPVDLHPDEVPEEEKDFWQKAEDFFNGFGESTSEWFDDNLGIVIPASGVLIIGVILLIILFRRKKR